MGRKIRRSVVIALTGLVAGAFVSGPAASAAAPETFAGSASGTALELKVLGQGLTLGHAKANADSGPKASAEGAGAFEPLVEPSASKAEAGPGTPDASQPDRCATPPLPEQLAAVLNAGLACSSASASITGGSKANATGTVAQITLGANTVLDQLPVTAPVEEALEQVLGALPDDLDPVTDTVGQVLDGVLHTQTLSIKLGASTADVTTAAAAVTAKGSAAGGQVDILPQGGLDGKPLASIIVGSSSATATYDRATGTSSAAFDPAIVTVVVRTPLTGEVKIPVGVGETVTILEGTPLESTIIAADGKTIDNPDGSKAAVADAVRLELLKGLNGGVVLGIGHSEAGIGGSPATQDPAPPKVLAELPRELPRTGGGMPALPVLGAGLLAIAVAGRRFLLARI